MLTPLGLSSYADVSAQQSDSRSEIKLLHDKLKTLAHLQSKGTSADIPTVLPFLDDPTPAIREIANDVITRILNKSSSRRYLSAAFRTLPFTVEDLSVLQQKYSGDLLCRLLAMASFNANGFVREKAVNMLAVADNALAIRFLIYRLNDNISSIREVAATAIDQYHRTPFYEEFLRLLPLVENILRIKKAYTVHVYYRIGTFLSMTELTPDILQFVKRRDKVRKLLFAIHVDRYGLTPVMSGLLLNDPDFRIRQWLMNGPVYHNREEEVEMYKRLLADKHPAVRIRALKAIIAADAVDAGISDCLCDSSPQVRRLASRVMNLNRQQEIDFYNSRTSVEKLTPGVILGLSDYGVFEGALPGRCLDHPDKRVVEATLSAMVRLDPHHTAATAVSLLWNATGSLRRYCIKIVARHYGFDIHDKVVELYNRGNVPQRKAAATIFGCVKSWHVFPMLMKAVLDHDENVVFEALYYARAWLRQSLRKKDASLRPDIIAEIVDMMAMSLDKVSFKDTDILYFGQFKDELRDFLKANGQFTRFSTMIMDDFFDE
jgi:hypothetical protein